MFRGIPTATDGASSHRVIQFVYICFSLPVQSAVVEQGFSIHRTVKSRLRNKLKVTTLDSLMRMKLLAPTDMADWKQELGTASAAFLHVGQRATAGASGDCPPLLREFWLKTAPGLLVLPDQEDELASECEDDADAEDLQAVVVPAAEFDGDWQEPTAEVDEAEGM